MEMATIPDHVLYQRLNDETVLLDMDSGIYFGLTPVASRFWELLAGGMSPADASAVLLNEYEVDRLQLEADLTTLLGDLLRRKLIDLRTSAG